MKTTKVLGYYCAFGLLLTTACSSEDLNNEQLISFSKEVFWNDNDRFPDYNTIYKVPEGYETFQLSQDYPKVYNSSNQRFPWESINFADTNEYANYMNAVLEYSLEESADNDFRIEKNTKRKWYHAPWMHNDDDFNKKTGLYVGAGREALRGLTQEITSKPGQLHANQKTPAQTWAIAFYNEPGGYTFGQVWKDADPNINLSTFPEGSVCYKLIFTDASLDEVPFLEGSLEWDAHIYDNTNKDDIKGRVVKKVRLLQLDIAIKDSRAEETEWVLGTYIYNGAKAGAKWYNRLEPVGLGWGNDFEDRTDINKFPNNFINPNLKESIINKEVLANETPNQAYVTHLGIGGRMNGPVDNPRSSCISCHGRAALNADHVPLPILDFSNKPYTDSMFNEYFQVVKGGVQEIKYKDTVYTTADFSFQLSIGIRNYHNHLNNLREVQLLGGRQLSVKDVISATRKVKQLPLIKRGN